MSTQNAFLGIDVGSISTKAVIIDEHNMILAQEYIWTEGNPIGAVKKLLGLLEKQLDRDAWQIVGVGATMGVDKGNYPTSKKVVFGVNITF